MFTTAAAWADDAVVAVATNFSEVLERLEREFERNTDHRVIVVAGSSGKLYAQITQGAPFDVLLSADQERPRRLVAEGLAVVGSQLTYAMGRLALWSTDPDLLVGDGRAVLRGGKFRRLAIANPELAPYGRAAVEALASFGLREVLQDKLVVGENVGQAYAMVATKNAELGFVALSYLMSPRHQAAGSRWLVPAHCHEPVRQDAVLLDANNTAAQRFMNFLGGARAGEIIRSYGYLTATADTPEAE